jgi:hypothetical protein
MRRGYQNDLIDDPQVSVVCDTLFFLMQGLTLCLPSRPKKTVRKAFKSTSPLEPSHFRWTKLRITWRSPLSGPPRFWKYYLWTTTPCHATHGILSRRIWGASTVASWKIARNPKTASITSTRFRPQIVYLQLLNQHRKIRGKNQGIRYGYKQTAVIHD